MAAKKYKDGMRPSMKDSMRRERSADMASNTMGQKLKDAGDSMMDLNDDKGQFAYLPQQVISKKYPVPAYDDQYNEQGREYQDREMDRTVSQAKRQKLDRHF